MRSTGLIVSLAVVAGAALAIWITSPRPTAAVPNIGLSPYELQLQTDISSLPELKIGADLI